MPEELDPAKLAMPTVEMEALMLHLSTKEVGILQHMMVEFKKRNPFRAQDPAVVRLDTKLAFLLAIILSIGDEPDLREAGKAKLMELYDVLLQQKQAMEKMDRP
jgi:hypothetical protein